LKTDISQGKGCKAFGGGGLFVRRCVS